MVDNVLSADTAAVASGKESSLSNWAGDYVTDMLGKGKAVADQGYEAYTGPLTAGSSDLQDLSFQGLGGLADTFTPENMGTGGYGASSFTGIAPDMATYGAEGTGLAGLGDTGLPPNLIQQYMNPYLQASLDPQIAEARRQSEIDRVNNASRLTKAGSFGGSRQAVMDAQNQDSLQRNLANITGQGYRDAYDKATGQYNTEQDRGMTKQDRINEYGMSGLSALADLGGVQRDIESEGITADRRQFEEERDFDYKNVQYLQSLLSGLPISAQSFNYQQPSYLGGLASDASDFESFLNGLFGEGFAKKPDATATVAAEEGTT